VPRSTDARQRPLLLAQPRHAGGGRRGPASRRDPSPPREDGCERVRLRGPRLDRLDPALIEIAATDALGLENSIARGRLLISAALGAAKLLEVGELDARLTVLEAAIGLDRADPDIEDDVA